MKLKSYHFPLLFLKVWGGMSVIDQILALLHRLMCLNTCFPDAGAALKIVKTLGYMSNYRRQVFSVDGPLKVILESGSNLNSMVGVATIV